MNVYLLFDYSPINASAFINTQRKINNNNNNDDDDKEKNEL